MTATLLPVAPFQETLDMGMCAPATLKMLLTYWNLPGQEKTDIELSKECETDPALGTSNAHFIEAARRFGLECVAKDHGTFDDIRSWLDKKIPVVVDWLTPGRKNAPDGEMPVGHYCTVVGLDESFIYMQDPELGELRTIPRKEFYRVWFDFETDTLERPEDLVLRYMIAARPANMAL